MESMKGRLEPGHFLRGNGKDETFKKFLEEMDQTYNALKHGGLPPRPSIPAIPKPVPAKDLITEALKVSDGIVFGESHREMASFKTLFDNVDTFKQQGVKKSISRVSSIYPARESWTMVLAISGRPTRRVQARRSRSSKPNWS